MTEALVLGEALIDLVIGADGTVVEAPGGSPMNVAITLARLGSTTVFGTALGPDPRGEVIRDRLAGSGVDLIRTTGLPQTSTATATVGSDGAAQYVFDIGWVLEPQSPLPAARVVHSGSLALFLEPGAVAVEQALVQAAEHSLVSIDPNIRAGLVGEHRAAVRRVERLASRAHLLKLSDEDAAWLYPGRTPQEVVDHVLAAGPSLVALTLGGHGSLIASADATVAVPAPRVRVADTIGAGDSFMGAMLHHLLRTGADAAVHRGEPLPAQALAELGRFAADVAAVTVSRPGADPPYRHEL